MTDFNKMGYSKQEQYYASKEGQDYICEKILRPLLKSGTKIITKCANCPRLEECLKEVREAK